MSASNTRRRLSLLTGSSFLAALVLAGAGGVTLAPTQAFAANECGDPGANTTGTDTFQCTGTHAAITYPTTNGTLTLQLLNDVTTTTGGLVVTVDPTANTAVTISRLPDNPVNSGDPSLTSTSGAGIQVTRATGGTITVNISETTNDAPDGEIAVSGTVAGVRLRNVLTGATSFTSTNGTITASAGAGIELGTTGTGALTVTNGSIVTGSTWGVLADKTSTGTVSITNNGTITGATGAVMVTGGTNATITNNAGFVMNGLVTMNNTGTSTITNAGEWNFTGTSFLGAGNTTLTNAVLGRIQASAGGVASTLDFGAGTNAFNHFGQLAVGGGAAGASTLTMTGLPTWNNSGIVLFGFDEINGTSDGAADDRIVSAGTLFTGITTPEIIGGTRFSFSQLMMDADFSADQSSCVAAVSADCLDLRGSSTAGTTQVVVRVAGEGPAQRLVLIDVGGSGTSAAEHFTLSDASPSYRALGDTGVVESGLFLYSLEYDETAKQHALVATALGGGSLEIARISRAASEPWRTATGMWHDRQADLRTTVAGRSPGNAPGVWLKFAGNYVNDSRYDVVEVGTLGQVEYNTSYDQRTTAFVGGVDLVRLTGDSSAFVGGVTAGLLNSELNTEAGTSLELEGNSFGAYASMVTGRLFVDGIVNLTNLDVVHMDIGDAFEGSAKSMGYQVEGGYRLFQVGDGAAYLEPIAALSYVRTELDDMEIGTVETSFDEASSLRGAIGARLGGDMVMDMLTAQFSVTGRIWNEFQGENEVTLSAPFGDTRLVDVGQDSLGDIGLALGLFTLGNRLSAHLNYGVKFNDGYQSTDAGVALRYNW